MECKNVRRHGQLHLRVRDRLGEAACRVSWLCTQFPGSLRRRVNDGSPPRLPGRCLDQGRRRSLPVVRHLRRVGREEGLQAPATCAGGTLLAHLLTCDGPTEPARESTKTFLATTCAAPNARRLRAEDPAVRARIRAVMTVRVRRVLSIAGLHGHAAIVLGAWGCGAFGSIPMTWALSSPRRSPALTRTSSTGAPAVRWHHVVSGRSAAALGWRTGLFGFMGESGWVAPGRRLPSGPNLSISYPRE